MRLWIPCAFAALAVIVATADTAAGQQQPPIRQLGAVAATSSEPLVMLAGVRALSSGSVLVNDPGSRRLLMFDPTLGSVTVIADSTSATANAYGGRMGGLIAFRGDSSLFVDPISMSMLVVDPAGKVARVMSIPRSQDAMSFVGGPLGAASYDPAGRLVYRSGIRMQMMRGHGAASAPPTPPQQPDSSAIVRVNLETRAVDTVTFIRTPRVNTSITRSDDGNITVTSEVNPLPIVDDWAVLHDGTIAVVRGRDYRVDWIAPNGAVRSSPKIPFEWQRLTDEDKAAFIDSVKAARERMQANGGSATAGDRAAAVGALGGGGMVVIREGGEGRPGGQMRAPQLNFVSPDQLPDYKPAFFAGAVRADTEGNLWIRTIPTKAIPGGPIYDVVNRDGQLVERVQVPEGRTIVGFGPSGAVYLSSRQGDRMILERASAR